ncbi:MAG: hypothetical protein Q8R36_01865 [bacterium]|nr:hypothetical protein [bacterium]
MKNFLKSTIYNLKPNTGFGLIEILIASAILSASLITLSATNQITFRLMKESLERTQANFLVEEAIEVVRILRDSSWSSHITPRVSGEINYLNFNAGANLWTIQTAIPPSIYNVFTRSVVFHNVYRRNSDGEIVAQNSPDPKTLDPDTKRVVAAVSWGSARIITLETYITNIFQN